MKKKKSVVKKLLKLLVCVVLILGLLYASRFLILYLAGSNAESIVNNSIAFSEAELTNDTMYLNFSDNNINPILLNKADAESHFRIDIDDDNYYSLYCTDVEKNRMSFSVSDASYISTEDDNTTIYSATDLDLEEGKIYRCKLTIAVFPPLHYKLNSFDSIISLNRFKSSDIEKYFVYENNKLKPVN